MRNRISALSALTIAAVCISGPRAQTKAVSVSVSPNQAESGKPFQVTLYGKSGLCAPIFTRHTVSVENGTLNLTVMGVSNPAALCAIGENAYQTDFNVPALRAGQYEVAARVLPACSFENPPCLPAMDPVEYGGILEVRDSASLNYGFRPKRVETGKAFGLFVFNKDYTCGNEFTDLATSVAGHTLTVSFTNRSHPETVCPAVVADYGPTFPIAAMDPGVYQVFTVAMPYCGTGPCPMAKMAPMLAGALTVGDGSVSLRLPQRPGAKRDPGPGRAGLSIDPRTGVTGWWRSEAASLTGRRR